MSEYEFLRIVLGVCTLVIALLAYINDIKKK